MLILRDFMKGRDTWYKYMFTLKRNVSKIEKKELPHQNFVNEKIEKKQRVLAKSIQKKDKESIDTIYSISYKLLGKKIQFLLPRFINIENNLMKAAMPVPYAAYMAGMTLISMIAGIFGVVIGIIIPLLINLQPIELDFVIPFATGIASFQITFFMMIKYPNMQASSRRKKISEELPYFMGYMATLASSGLTLEGIFKAVARDDSKEEIVNDAKYLVRNIDLLGMDIISAIRDLARRSPLEPYSELLEGLIATVQSGGNLKEYFIATANVQLEEKKLLLKKMTESLGMVAEMYTMLLIVFPLMAVIMLSIMAIMSPTLGGLSLSTLMNLLTYGFVPVLGIMMLIMIDSMIPKR